MITSYINPETKTRDVLTAFRGYNHREVISDGEWYDDMNLTSGEYPVLSQREKRQIHTESGETQIPISACRNSSSPCLIYKYLNLQGFKFYKMYYGHEQSVSFYSSDPGEILQFGNYLFSYKLKKYVDVTDSTCKLKDIEKYYDNNDSKTGGNIQILVDGIEDVEIYDDTVKVTEVDKYDVSQNVDNTYEYKSDLYNAWLPYTANLTRISSTDNKFNAAVKLFEKGDFVTVKLRNNRHGVKEISGKVIASYTDDNATRYNIVIDVPRSFVLKSQDKPVLSIERKMPNLDLACVHNNRVWGCSNETGEIFCSALGDLTQWYTYEGLSTDSWAATVPGAGDFTACCSYGGYVVFFKENEIIKVSGTKPSNFTTVRYCVPGVKAGCNKSVVNVSETLYYCSPIGFCMYQTGTPSKIDYSLGSRTVSKCISSRGGNNKVYVGFLYEDKANDNEWELMAFDTHTNIWHRESVPQTEILDLFDILGNVYVMSGSGNIGDCHMISCLYGDMGLIGYEGYENDISWYAVSGRIGLQEPDNKYYSKIQLKLCGDPGAEFSLSAAYDGSDDFRPLVTISDFDSKLLTCTAPLRRCTDVRLKLEGKGKVKIYMLSKQTEQGSEI